MLIHIGYPKTGSTWLQRSVFKDKITGLQIAANPNKVRALLARPQSLWYEPEEAEDFFSHRLEKAAASGWTPVLSDELLVGHPFAGGAGCLEIARRLNDHWPKARVLIVIREQKKILLSLYGEYVRNGGPLSLSEYLYPTADRQPVFDLRYLEYDRLIRYYFQLFTKNNVLVLPFEELVRDPLAFVNRILAFCSSEPVSKVKVEKERVSLGGATIKALSKTNRWFRRDENYVTSPFDFPWVARVLRKMDSVCPDRIQSHYRKKFEEYIREQVDEFFINSNSETGRITGIRMSEYGYIAD